MTKTDTEYDSIPRLPLNKSWTNESLRSITPLLHNRIMEEFIAHLKWGWKYVILLA